MAVDFNKAPEEEDNEDRLYNWLGPAPTYVDHFALRAFSSSGVMRIAFGEWLSRKRSPIYRVGIAMPIPDARVLLRELRDALKEYDEKQAAKTSPKE
jgi:hypothetical protein